jgi:hypothetical protein
MHGFTQYCAPGFNEQTLELAGLALLETEDRTHGIWRNARGRLEARFRHQADFEQAIGERFRAALTAFEYAQADYDGSEDELTGRALAPEDVERSDADLDEAENGPVAL